MRGDHLTEKFSDSPFLFVDRGEDLLGFRQIIFPGIGILKLIDQRVQRNGGERAEFPELRFNLIHRRQNFGFVVPVNDVSLVVKLFR